MLWFAAAASIFAAGVICCKRAGQSCLILCSGEDDDIKIAPEFPSRHLEADAGEVAALEFADQKEKGNIQKAYLLGTRLAGLLLNRDPLLDSVGEEYDASVYLNARALFAFAVDCALETSSASDLIVQTAANFFYESLKMADPVLYENIILPEAFSLYLLSIRDSNKEDKNIGYPFAKLCGREEDMELISLGNRIYSHSLAVCREQISRVEFQ